MADKTLDFTIHVKDEGSNVIKKIGVNTEELGKVIRGVKQEMDKLSNKVVDMAQLSLAFKNISSVITQVQGSFRDLTAATAAQTTAETQLTTVMRQRMGATNEQIQSIKDLCSAQQEQGVIGDEVALSGAQQMAAFLNEKKSLDSLIPAMNDLLARQEGLNATTGDAASIGKMMGEAMQGQAGALQQVGITFSEAQQKVLAYGTESERAALLAQVIANNVGGMNAALAATDVGQQKQLENSWGNTKEQLGGVVQMAIPLADLAAQFFVVSAGALQLSAAISSGLSAIKGLELGAKAAALQAQAITVATKTWSIVQGALNTVMASNPIGLIVVAISALTAGVIYCYTHFEGFRKVCDAVWSAVKKMASAVWDHLVKAFQKASTVIKAAWEWVKKFFGISDNGVKDTTEDIREQTGAINENADALKALEEKYGNYKPDTGTGSGMPEKAEPRKGSIAWLDDQLGKKQTEMSLAINDESRRNIQMEIDKLTGEKRTIELNLQYSKPVEDTRQREDMTGMKSHFATAKRDTSAITPEKLNVNHKYFNTYEASLKKAQKAQDKFRKGTGAVAEAFGNIGNAIGGAAGQWLQYGASVLNAIGQAIPAILTMLGVQAAEEQQSHKNASANAVEAGSKAMKAHAGIPFVGVALGVAAVAAIIAAMVSIPKFETGGMVGGSSFYGDKILARVNSGEMILNRGQQARLYGMVNNGSQSGMNGKVTFKIEGRTLKGVLEKVNDVSLRS